MLKYANTSVYVLGEGARVALSACGSGIRASTHREPPPDHEMFRHQRFGEISISNQNMIAGVGV